MRSLLPKRNISWAEVICFAVASAVLTAALKLIPALRDTSFQDIAISFECWILFAMWIIVSCRSCWEASGKVFVFFLISQPLIYLLQVPFYSGGFSIFRYYPYWFGITLLTIPGAAFAFLVRKKNWWSVLPLSLINALLACLGVTYAYAAYGDFPHHLISALFCFTLIVLFTLSFTTGKRRLVLTLFTVAVIACFACTLKPISSETVALKRGRGWTYTVDADDVVAVTDNGDGTFTLQAKKKGNARLCFTDRDGTLREFYVTVSGGAIFVNEMSD